MATASPLARLWSHPLLALGFRPFFLGAGVLALLAMLVWLARLWGLLPGDGYLGGTAWHAHEMLFGYVGAVIAGFLLTAARNWTGIATPTGAWLGALVLLWLAARLGPLLSLPHGLIALLDLAFFPALALALIPPLWRGKNKVNRAFLALLAAMTLANLLVHAQALGLTAATASRGSRLMLDLTLLTLWLVAGRIMPFFTQSAITGSKPRTRPWVETSTFVLAPAIALLNLTWPASPVSGALLLILAAIQAIRLGGWHHPLAWRNPMLAVLYAGYLWLILGLALDGLAAQGLLPPFPALHALTAGGIGVFTLGMLARVTLGHTGRDMRASRATSLAFLTINLAALVRVFPPLLWPRHYSLWLGMAGGLWVLAFALFLGIYGPMLARPRVDGRPG
ncbi:MAG: NnrS family protein [Chromatiaceae bacterium]|nr:NnrS family protein [Candidatus Thioaporhodococcus sediminis]